MESIHGHDVMQMIADAKSAYSNKAELVSAIGVEFGSGARFHTCSAENMNAGELVDFLIARGKFGADPQTLTLDASAICQH